MIKLSPHNLEMKSQKKAIGNLLHKPLNKGDTWNVINAKWLRQWKKYVGFYFLESSPNFNVDPQQHPGEIENSSLLTADGKLAEDLINKRDYELIPAEAWELLVFWYGQRKGQQSIPRKVIQHGVFVKTSRVEIYPMDLKLHTCIRNKTNRPVTEEFSLSDTISKVEQRMRTIFGVERAKEVRIWRNNRLQLFNVHVTIEEAAVKKGQIILMEVQNDDGSWPKDENFSVFSAINDTTEIDPNSFEFKENFINCAICFSIMTTPLQLLPCHHTFCEKCVTRLPKVINDSTSGFFCPSCRQFTSESYTKLDFDMEQLIKNCAEKKRGSTSMNDDVIIRTSNYQTAEISEVKQQATETLIAAEQLDSAVQQPVMEEPSGKNQPSVVSDYVKFSILAHMVEKMSEIMEEMSENRQDLVEAKDTLNKVEEEKLLLEIEMQKQILEDKLMSQCRKIQQCERREEGVDDDAGPKGQLMQSSLRQIQDLITDIAQTTAAGKINDKDFEVLLKKIRTVCSELGAEFEQIGHGLMANITSGDFELHNLLGDMRSSQAKLLY